MKLARSQVYGLCVALTCCTRVARSSVAAAWERLADGRALGGVQLAGAKGAGLLVSVLVDVLLGTGVLSVRVDPRTHRYSLRSSETRGDRCLSQGARQSWLAAGRRVCRRHAHLYQTPEPFLGQRQRPRTSPSCAQGAVSTLSAYGCA